MNPNPLISVIIPVKNGIKTIKSCLTKITEQSVYDKIEIIVIDSGSTDGTIEILKSFHLHLIQIPPKEFNHGDTRNLGVKQAKGEFIVFTVMDALPCDNFWIENMHRHFRDDNVAAVCGQQIVIASNEKNPIEWFKPVNSPTIKKVQFKESSTWQQLSSKEKFESARWDNVTAMYRKSILQKIPFVKTMYAEDLKWAIDALSQGYLLVFDNHAKVNHYHHHTFKTNFQRTFTVMHQTFMITGLKRKSNSFLMALLRTTYRIFRMQISFSKKVYWWRYNLTLTLSNRLAVWLYIIIATFFSLNRCEQIHNKICKSIPEPKR